MIHTARREGSEGQQFYLISSPISFARRSAKAILSRDESGDDDDEEEEEEEGVRRGGGNKKNAGRRKITIQFIEDKAKRQITV